jgi:hypothetical protein
MHVDFEYLEPRQGFNVELLVTGEITDEPIPTGTIIGMPRGFRKFDAEKRRAIGCVFAIIGVIVILGGFVIIVKLFNVDPNANGLMILIPSLLISCITAFAAMWSQGISRGQGIPRDLRT